MKNNQGGTGMGMGMPGGRPAAMSLRNLRTFNSFKNPIYRLYYAGNLGQMAAMNMQIMARSLLIYRLTGSPLILGAMSFANAIPTLFLSLFGGVIADRVQKKYVMQVGQISSAVVSLGVALTLTLGYLSVENPGSWWILVVASVFQGIIMGLMMPSRQAILPEIVSGEELMNAISLNTLGMNALRLLAPALTGFLIEAIGFEAVYYVTSGLYLTSVFFIYFLPPTSTISIRGGGALASIKEGISYIRGETTILFVLGYTLIGVVLAMPFMQLMPVFTEDILKVGARGLGILLSVSGAGAMAGSIILASLPNKKRGLMLLVSGVLLGLALASFSFSNSWVLSLALIVFVGLGQSAQMALGMTLVQYYVSEAYLGRVMSIMMMQFGITSFGAFLAGVVAEGVGVQWAIGSFAVTLAFLSLLSLIFIGRIRRLD